MRALRIVAIIVATIVVVLCVALLALVLLLDPDTFKPRIEAMAREQGVALHIDSDMSWQFWPALGIEINDVRAAALEQPTEPIARLGHASLLVALKPLLQRQLRIHHIIVDGAVIELIVDEQGHGNWEPLLQEQAQEAEPDAAEPPAPPAPTGSTAQSDKSSDTPLQLAVDRISLTNSALHFTSHAAPADPTASPAAADAATEPQDFYLTITQLELEQFNLQGQPFDLTLAGEVAVDDARVSAEPVTIAVHMGSRITLGKNMQKVDLSQGELTLAIAGSNDSNSTAQLNFNLAVTDLQQQPQYAGELILAPLNLKKMLASLGQAAPETSEAYALTELALTANLQGSDTQLTLDPFTITLDKTQLTGRFALTDFASGAVELKLDGDSINVDHYLPPEADTPAVQPVSTGDEILIPLDTIRPLNLDVAVNFDQLTVAKLPFKQVQLEVSAADALVRLERVSADLYDGTLVTTGSLNARTDTAVIEVVSGAQALHLAPLMRDQQLDEKIQLTGAINATLEGTTHGLTLNQLLQAANGEAHFAGDQIRLAPLNIEEKFCQIVNLANGNEDAPKDWPDYSEVEQVAGRINLVEGVATIEQLTAAVSHLGVGAEGAINFFTGDYDVTLPLQLMEKSTSAEGCQVQSNYWLNRSLKLLRCRGSLDALDPVRDCRPDSKGVASLVKDFATYKFKQENADKIDAAEQKLDAKKTEVKDKLRDKLEEEFGGEEAKKLEDRLKGLLRR